MNSLSSQTLVSAHKEEKETEGAQTAVSDRVRRLERTVAEKLTEFLYCDVSCSIRRVYAADLAHLYVGPVTSKGLHFVQHFIDCHLHPAEN